MAETTSAAALRFSCFSPLTPSVSRARESIFSSSSSCSSCSIPLHPFHRIKVPSFFGSRSRTKFLAKSFDSQDADNPFEVFPWESSHDAIQWVPEDKVTLFTADGLIQIGGSLVPRRIPSSDKQGRSKGSQRLQRFQESDYMDPEQGLCLGALFNIAATNGLDTGRRLCIFGFCRSIEMLSDVVEDTVLEHGGEVVAAEKASKGGLHEKLIMRVAVPLLWGVPPASETLRLAVTSGGGIVEKVYCQWDFL